MANRPRFTGIPGEDPRFMSGGSFVNATQVRGLQRLLAEKQAIIDSLEDRLEVIEGLVLTEFELNTDLWVPRTEWTPVVTQGGTTTLTIHNAMYEVSNGFCTFSMNVTIASVSGTTAGTQIACSMPVAAHVDWQANIHRFGLFQGVDTSNTANNRQGVAVAVANSTTNMRFGDFTSAGSLVWGNNPSFALAANDRLAVDGRYPVA